jgi:hypothetical protein
MQKFLTAIIPWLVLVSAANAQGQLTSSSPVNAWSPRSPGSGLDGGSYRYDDGSSESALGITNCTVPGPALVLWLHRFDAQPGMEIITQISTTYGSTISAAVTPPAGTPAGVALYADPNQDGDPTDAVLLSVALTTVQAPGTDIFHVVPIVPTAVAGIFFVAAWSESTCAQPPDSTFPAPLDTNQSALGRAWVAGMQNAQLFDPANLGVMDVGPLDLAAIGFASQFLLRAEGESAAVTTYCNAKLNSLGCLPAIGAVGIPSASATSGFEVRAQNVRNQSAGVLLYGNTGQLNQPFSGGTLCLRTPFRRAPAANAGGSSLPAADCSGLFSVDLSSFAHGSLGGTPAPFLLIPGSVVNCQWWGRDTGFPAPNNTTLSDALEFTIQ